MEIIVNGESKSIVDDPLAITDLLKLLNVEMPDMVSVQLNGNFVERTNFASIFVKEKDEIDFLYFLGGGSMRISSEKRCARGTSAPPSIV
jgi:sulfur carrier protein